MEIMIFKKDNLKLGLILGLLGPAVGLLVIYFVQFPSYSFGDFLDEFFNNNRLITSIGSLALLANAVIFAIYVHFNKYNTFKGIFIVTLVYGIAILILKVFN
jgi:drug/metabolite transporter (DMT)-like permease